MSSSALPSEVRPFRPQPVQKLKWLSISTQLNCKGCGGAALTRVQGSCVVFLDKTLYSTVQFASLSKLVFVQNHVLTNAWQFCLYQEMLSLVGGSPSTPRQLGRTILITFLRAPNYARFYWVQMTGRTQIVIVFNVFFNFSLKFTHPIKK